MQGKPRSGWLQSLTSSRFQDIQASFATIGGHLAWVTVQAPFHFYILFSGRLSAKGGCDTQVVFLFPKGTGVRFIQALALMYVLLHDDHRVLETLAFRPGFTEADTALRLFAETVNRIPTW
jgi:hypothetical protein